MAVSLDDDLFDLEGGLDGVRLVVDPFKLLESAALGFDTVVERVSRLSNIEYEGRRKTYPKKYQATVSTRSQPTKTKMYL